MPFSWHTGLRLSFNPEAASPEKPEATLNLAWVVNSVYYFFSSEGERGLLNHSTHKPRTESEGQSGILGQPKTFHSLADVCLADVPGW